MTLSSVATDVHCDESNNPIWINHHTTVVITGPSHPAILDYLQRVGNLSYEFTDNKSRKWAFDATCGSISEISSGVYQLSWAREEGASTHQYTGSNFTLNGAWTFKILGASLSQPILSKRLLSKSNRKLDKVQ